jgi:hypothetical protein
MKKCPYCAEDIQDAAIVCKHCNRDLLPSAAPPRPSKSSRGWGCLTAVVLSLLAMGWCVAAVNRSAPPDSNSTTAIRSPSRVPEITAEDMKREKRGRYRQYQFFAVEKEGTTAVFFQPALARNDEVVIGAVRKVLSEVMGINAESAEVRPVDRVLRFTTPSGAFDVLLLKEDNGTVNGFTIQKVL